MTHGTPGGDGHESHQPPREDEAVERRQREYPHESGDRNTRKPTHDDGKAWEAFEGGEQRDDSPDAGAKP